MPQFAQPFLIVTNSPVIAAALRQVFHLLAHDGRIAVIRSLPSALKLRSFPSPIFCFEPDIRTVRRCLRHRRLVCMLGTDFRLADFVLVETDWHPAAIRTTCGIVADWLHLRKSECVELDGRANARLLKTITADFLQPLIELGNLGAPGNTVGMICREVMSTAGATEGVSMPSLLAYLEEGLRNAGKEL